RCGVRWVDAPVSGGTPGATSGGPGYESTNLAYLIYNQALLQFDVGMASAGGLIAVLIANIAAIVLVRMIGKNLTERS
ncbi:hypothetical protein ACLBWA_34765, partial [Pseudomonas aeruginosa]